MSTCPRCGQKTRSYPQLKRFFALVSAAYQHWPAAHEFRPESEEHLRKWLLIKAGFCTEKTIRLEHWMPRQAVILDMFTLTIEAAIKASGSYPFIQVHTSHVLVKSAHSVSYRTSHATACKMFQAVDEIIELETGVRGEDMLKATETAA